MSDTIPGPVIVINGSLAAGFKFFGPFPEVTDAWGWLKRVAGYDWASQGDWEVVTLSDPEELS